MSSGKPPLPKRKHPASGAAAPAAHHHHAEPGAARCHCLRKPKRSQPARAISPHGACDRRRGSQSSSHAPASSDIPGDEYSWRKYGQKPINGSPYPHGYYRCSSAKGCPARKHEERAADDPAMLVVTYEGDHRHDAPAGAARAQ